MTTGKTIVLTGWTFVGKVMSLLFKMLSRVVIAFLPRSKCLLISWLQSPSAVILETPKHNRSLVDHQAPLSMEFSRQEYWSGFPFHSPGDLPDPGIKPHCSSPWQLPVFTHQRTGNLPHWADSLPMDPPGKPSNIS